MKHIEFQPAADINTIERIDFHLVSGISTTHTNCPYASPAQEATATRLSVLIRLASERGWIDQYTPIRLEFTLKGTTAGTAEYKGGWFIININNRLLINNSKEIIEEVMPHELAHILCYKNYQRCKPHGREWEYICKALGGTGERCHSMPVQKVRMHTKYLYASESGMKIYLGRAVHMKVMRGQARILHKTKERITSSHYTGHFERM